MQGGLVIGVDGGDPRVEAAAVAAGEDLGEGGDVPGQGVQVRAAGADVLEANLVVGVQVVGAAQDPAGDVTDLRWPAGAWWADPSRNGFRYRLRVA